MHFSPLRRYRKFRDRTVEEFYQHISPLLENDLVQKLDLYTQHNCYSRLAHCLDVAYYSFFLAKLLRFDSKSAARGGLLHDIYFYDRDDEDVEIKNHMAEHPRVALANARSICELNQVEENIILRHMWLFTPIPPRYKEGFVVSFVDKYCAVREGLIGLRNRRLSRKLAAVARA